MRKSLEAHHQKIRELHLRELFSDDPKRGERMTVEAVGIYLDYSKNRITDESGEGRWTIKAAIDEGVPVPVLTTALYERFSSRGEADYQDKLLSAMRYGFGGHLEKSAK
jgi:6-phosphogluconate dehydrogenase (decarboxylating)